MRREIPALIDNFLLSLLCRRRRGSNLAFFYTSPVYALILNLYEKLKASYAPYHDHDHVILLSFALFLSTFITCLQQL